MADQMTKSKLLDIMSESQTRWQALLAEVGEERMTRPGVEGDWSVKDIVAHVNFYEDWLVGYLQSALRGEKPQSNPETAGVDTDQQNAWVYERIRDRPLRDVLEESPRIFARLLETVQALP